MTRILARIIGGIRKHGLRTVAEYALEVLYVLVRKHCGRLRLSVLHLLHKAGVWEGLLSKVIVPEWGGYRVIALGELGYATRAMAHVPDEAGGVQVVTAEVGDDSISILRFDGSEFTRCNRINFPRRSAPMAVACIRQGGEDDHVPLVGTFNYDVTHEQVPASRLYGLDHKVFECNGSEFGIDEVGEELLVREGHHGFRAIASCGLGNDRSLIAITDRDSDVVWVAEKDWIQSVLKESDFYTVELSSSSDTEVQPIGIAILPPVGKMEHPRILVGQRQSAAITVLSKDRSGRFSIERSISIDGLSRSSISVAEARGKGKYDVLVALWGGDPQDLDTPRQGKVAVVEVTEEGDFTPVRYLDSGTHPTDVVSGDFDGDGKDEVAVLNYGAGLSLKTRTDRGDVRILKHIDGEYREVTRLMLPSPRIGHTVRLGRDEPEMLLVSLFFERKVAAIKFGRRAGAGEKTGRKAFLSEE